VCLEAEVHKACRLKQALLKGHLTKRYGDQIADKMSHMFDFSTQVALTDFQSQIESIMKNKDLLHQMAFDLYDANNDE
jgi:hypothetical protein